MTRSLPELKALYAESIYQVAKYSAIAAETKALIELTAVKDAAASIQIVQKPRNAVSPGLVGITPKQLAILSAIRTHMKKDKLVPTYEEVATKVGCSKSNARHIIHRLVEKNLLHRAPGRYRNFVVTNAGRAALQNASLEGAA